MSPCCFPHASPSSGKRRGSNTAEAKVPMPKLTKRTVDAIRPDPAGDVFVWDVGDGALKGFGIRMKPSGVASYLIQYRNAEGRTRRLALGRVGTLTPDHARALAQDKLTETRKGGDPSAERHAARQ